MDVPTTRSHFSAIPHNFAADDRCEFVGHDVYLNSAIVATINNGCGIVRFAHALFLSHAARPQTTVE